MHRYLGQQKNHYDEIEGGMISKRDEKAVPNAVITRENRILKIILDSSGTQYLFIVFSKPSPATHTVLRKGC